ncbi:hypothetical protein KY306_00690 [Candidatus Woesearchaeota archaeon]|nr:hypothetical protein [Candidatus Woesearchaeota archaeon]
MKKEAQIKLLELSKISLWLDDYNDIFSDFDSRPYEQRSLSDDFLLEAKKATRDKASGTIELNILVPQKLRNSHHEIIIKKRLRDYFKKNHFRSKKEIRGLVNHGLIFTFIGTVLMFVSTLIFFEEAQTTFFLSFLVVMLQPAGWFLFWEGLRMVIFESRTKKPEMEFNEKMSKCEIHFLSYQK